MGTTPKVILVVVPTLFGGGAERAAAWLAGAWARDHRVVTAVFDGSRATYFPGGEVVDLKIGASTGFLRKAFASIRRIYLLRKLIRKLRPDRTFGFMENANLPLMLAALAAGTRRNTVVSVRCNPAHIRWFHKICAQILYPFAGEVAVVSHGAARGLSRVLSIQKTLVQVRYSPLPLETLRDLASHSPLRLPNGPYFFSAGRLVPGKDFTSMIRIFASLKDPNQDLNLQLVIAGEGPERSQLEALIASEGLSGRVLLSGRLENPFALMQGALAFLLTSQHEGFPMVLLEAMACGCPVVAFDCDYGPAEVVADSGAGFVIPLGDGAAFASSLRRLAEDSALRERMGVAAINRASDFEANKIAASWLDVESIP